MPPWSSALAASLEEDRVFHSTSFVEARSLLLQTTSNQFTGGEAERADALAQTEHDYNALVEATNREAETAALLTIQLRELSCPQRAQWMNSLHLGGF